MDDYIDRRFLMAVTSVYLRTMSRIFNDQRHLDNRYQRFYNRDQHLSDNRDSRFESDDFRNKRSLDILDQRHLNLDQRILDQRRLDNLDQRLLNLDQRLSNNHDSHFQMDDYLDLRPPYTRDQRIPYSASRLSYNRDSGIQMDYYRNQHFPDNRSPTEYYHEQGYSEADPDRWHDDQRGLKYRRTEVDPRRGYQADTRDKLDSIATMAVKAYVAHFQHAFKFELRSILPADKIAGLDTLATVIRGWVREIDSLRKDIIQYSRAFVIKNASGVGKTFGSVAVASVLNQGSTKDSDFYLPLYVGFNSDFPLSATELFYLRRDAWLVESIIARRTLHQLWALVALCKAEGNTDKKLWDIVVQGEGGSRHLVPLPTEEDTHLFGKHNVFPRSEQPVIASLINELSKRCGGRRLVVLFIMGEGQKFDEVVRPPQAGAISTAAGGARQALQYARSLQLECSKSTKALLLPIMTGINPDTSLTHATDGTNVVYSGPLHTKKEFLAIANALMEKGIKVKNIGLLATLMYPVTRDLELFFTRIEPIRPFKPHPCVVNPDLAPLYLMASGTDTKIDNRYWEPTIPANFDADGIHFTPMPSFLRIDECLGHCEHIRWAIGEDFRACDSNVRSIIDERERRNAFIFESEVARMLQIILATTNTPIWSCAAGTDYEKEYEEMRAKWLAKNPWMDFKGATRFPLIDTLPGRSKFIYPTAAKQRQEPFELLGKLAAIKEAKKDKALKARVATIGQSDPHWQRINLHPLHEDVSAELNAMKSKGQCYSIRCQGSAPLDFIYIVLTCDRGPDGRCNVELRLADAKYMYSSKTDSTCTIDKTVIDEMLPKFASCADYLQIALSNECGMTVVGQRHAIITNCSVTEQARKLFGPKVKGPTAATAAVTCVLSPETFKFRPFTTYLFSEEDTE